MFVLPAKLAVLSRDKVVQSFEQLSQRDLGYGATEYFQALIGSLRESRSENCDSYGLVLAMTRSLDAIQRRDARNAIQHAIPAFLDHIARSQSDPADRQKAQRFVDEVVSFGMVRKPPKPKWLRETR